MLILAIDTTSEMGGVGIFRDAAYLALVANEGPANRYSVSLFEMLEQALGQARLELRQIELFAAANGPGSFTGIRVGLAAARAWGKAFGKPVRGVSVLEAMVHKQELATRDTGLATRDTGLGTRDTGIGEPATSRACLGENEEAQPSPGGEGVRWRSVPAGIDPRRASEGSLPSQVLAGPDWLFPIVDARREEFFVGSFRKTVGARHGVPLQYEPADAGWVLKPDALRAYLEERAAHGASASCLVRAHDQAAVELRASLPASLTWQQIAGPLMDSIAAIALKEDLSGQPPSDAKLDAYYIRRPDAEINWIDD